MEFEEFKANLPKTLGDEYYNDPETKQEPTKAFDNFKDFNGMAKSFLQQKRENSKKDAEYAEKMQGMVKVPGENATDDEVKAYRKAIGVPDKAEDYVLELPDIEDEKTKAGYQEIATIVSNAAHEAGVPTGAINKVFGKVVQSLLEKDAQIEQAGKELLDKDIEALKTEKGTEYNSFIISGDNVLDVNKSKIATAGEFKEFLETMGFINYPVVRRFLAEISPQFLSGKNHLSPGGGNNNNEEWYTDYSEVEEE